MSRASTPLGDLYIVADGVGGYENGAEAAQAVVDGFARELIQSSPIGASDALKAAAERINRELEQRGSAKDPPSKMSSTVVLALVSGSTATIAHVGDSRAYLIRSGRLSQITRDHSVMQRLIDQGAMGAAEARDHAGASILTQALGQAHDVEPGITTVEMYPGDVLLLCSDGLWAYASDAEMEAVAASDLSASGAAEALLHVALQGGGGDNIGIQFLRFAAEPIPVALGKRIFGIPARVAVALGAAMAVAMVIAAGLTAWNYTHGPDAPPSEPPLFPVVLTRKALAKTGPETVYAVNDQGARARWIPQARKLKDFTVMDAQTSAACLALERTQDILYFRPRSLAAARHIQTELHLRTESVVELAFTNEDCGNGDLIAVPAKRLAAGIEGKARKAAKSLEDQLGEP